ncbi:hypothetical protein L211DRAFT_901702 [Terfezia boudieri ATCC MYA-4762]|uniref:Uncharacterized protein n=1 Tax=Terfezia boudieri ATCC MYA-4762 TaxID=1051890 RepID=A0A3N4L6W4_9PEZI|nr:hypothetical protein L211DRAFT_901702 [Terfezia boudieri ATCC MYA-4762]
MSDALDLTYSRSTLSSQRNQDYANYPAKYNADIDVVSVSSISNEDRDGALACVKIVTPEAMEISRFLRYLGNTLCEHFRFGGHLFYTPTSSTRLIAVLGVPDPEGNDWLILDFCLLHKILGGVAAEETWLGSSDVDLHQFITKTGKEILHGYGRANRRVVFSKDEPDFMTHTAPHQLKQDFLDTIKNIAMKAEENERIMVIIVAHGSRSGEVGIGCVGEGPTEEEVVTRDEVEAVLAPAADGVQVTILSTACFSGLWAVPFEALKTQPTVLAATEANEINWSFPESGSSRHRGSFHVAAVANQFGGLAQKNVQPNSMLAEAKRISGEDIRPRPLIRAISLGDLTRTAAPIRHQPGTIAAFSARLRKEVIKWPAGYGTLRAKPTAYIAKGGGRKSAAGVLGMDDPQALPYITGLCTITGKCINSHDQLLAARDLVTRYTGDPTLLPTIIGDTGRGLRGVWGREGGCRRLGRGVDTIITDSSEKSGSTGASKSDSQSSISHPDPLDDSSVILDSGDSSKWTDTFRR